ncbi:tetratricopeptide repeat-containing sensor histidine kinase [Halocola ammonii]
MRRRFANQISVFLASAVLLMLTGVFADLHSQSSSGFSNPAELLQQGKTAYEKKNYEQSEALADSALNMARDQNLKSELVHSLLLSARIYSETGRPVRAIHRLNELLAVEIDDKAVMAEAELALGDIYLEQKSPDLAEKHYLTAYKHFKDEENPSGKAKVLSKVGKIKSKDSDYDKAIKNLERALAIYRQQNDELKIGYTQEEIALLKFRLGDYRDAEDHFLAAIEIYRKYDFRSSENFLLDYLIEIYAEQGKYGRAIQFTQRGLEINLLMGDSLQVKNKYEKLSLLFEKGGDYRESIKMQEKAITYAGESDFRDRSRLTLRLAELCSLANRDTDALLHYHDAMRLARKSQDYTFIQKAAKAISDFYFARDDYQTAYKFLSISDSLQTVRSEELVAQMQAKIQQKNQEQIEFKKEAAVEMDELEDRNTALYQNLMIGSIIVLVLVLFFLYREFIQKRKLSKVLEWKVYKRTRELRKANKELNTYIYKSSHDLRTPLTSIKSLLRLLKTEEHNATTAKYLGLIDACSEQMDDILVNLSRAVDYKNIDVKVEKVDFKKLQYDLESKEITELDGVKLIWNIRENTPFFSDPKLLKVILRKTITNAIDYRNGTENDFCKVTITTDQNGAVLAIEDNGVGISEKVKENVFDMFVKGTHKSKGAGLGLYLVKIATDKIRGSITLESNEKKGSKLIFQLPNLNA